MVSKACIVGIYQKKLSVMVEAEPDLHLTVVVPPYWRDERGRIELERVYTEGYRLDVRSMCFNGAYHLHFYPTLHQVIADEQPDLVHIDEEPYNLATYQANVLGHRARAKTLWFSWQNLARRYPPPFSWMEQYNLVHVDHVLVGSRSAAEVWRAKGYRGDLDVVPQFGVDPAAFCPPTQRPSGGSVHIAYVGRFVPEKGCDVLVEALARVGGEWEATLLGSGPSYRALRKQVTRLGLDGRVTFMEWLSSTQMPAFYKTVDILVLPSSPRPNWTEQFGRVLIEAMASEAAVVGSDAGEIPYVIDDAGVVFPAGDVGALADKLRELIDDPEYRYALGSQGRRQVLERYTHQHVADATLSVYRRLVG